MRDFLSKRRVLFELAGLFTLLILRQWNRIERPMVWAEDGAVYLQEAYRDGLASFVHPSSGYFHGIQRLVAYGLSLVPPTWVPFHWIVILNLAISTLIFTVCVGAFVGEKFAHWVPSRWDRLGIALCICFAPGLDEILGNLANLHSVCALYLFLIAVRAPNTRLCSAELFFAALCVLTAGEGAVLVPLFALRVLRENNRADWAIGLGLAASAALVVNAALSDSTVREHAGLADVLWKTLQGWIWGFGNWVALFPWAGFRLTSNIGGHASILWWFFLASAAYLALRQISRNRGKRVAWAMWAMYFVQIIFLTTYVRGLRGASLIWTHPIRPWPDPGRYAFILAPYAIFFWAFLLGRRGLRVFILVYCLHGLSGGLRLPDYDVVNPDWQKTNAQIEAAFLSGCPREVSVEAAPRGWAFMITVPSLEKKTCQ